MVAILSRSQCVKYLLIVSECRARLWPWSAVYIWYISQSDAHQLALFRLVPISSSLLPLVRVLLHGGHQPQESHPRFLLAQS